MLSDTRTTCTFPGCNLPLHLPYDNEFCLGHAPIENKKCTEQEFFQFLNSKKFNTNDYNFDGFKFPFSEIFDQPYLKNFNTPVRFRNCEFHGTKKVGKQTICFFAESIHFQNLDFSNSTFYYDCVISKCDANEIKMNEVELKGGFQLEVTNSANLISRKGIFNGPVKLKFINGLGAVQLQKTIFNNRLDCWKQIFNKNVEIFNCHFNGEVVFKNSIFNKKMIIQDSNFLDRVIFANITCKLCFSILFSQFKQDFVISQSEFQDTVEIAKTKFYGGFWSFGSNFLEESLFKANEFHRSSFSSSIFHYASVFDYSTFYLNSSFDKTRFQGFVSFRNAVFSNIKEASYSETGTIYFYSTHFNGEIDFEDIQISCFLIFSSLIFSETAFFKLKRIHQFGECQILFENISFKPFKTSFEEFISNPKEIINPNIIAFRNCDLRNVLFSNCLMNNFSFYKSTFELAIFISSKWANTTEKKFLFNYLRKNIIFEDYFYAKLVQEDKSINDLRLKKYYHLLELSTFEEIANLYRRFKVALDNTKDYEQAGWFYFNEYERKRRACLEDSETRRKYFKKKREFKRKSKSKYLIYSLYKLFAGYGEKPLWSFYWLLLSTFIFSIINLFNGIKFNGKELFNYDWEFSVQGVVNVINFSWFIDFIKSIAFTISRIIPLGYLPIPKEQFIATTPTEYIISIANTLVLLFFLTCIGVGLKRIFRRF